MNELKIKAIDFFCGAGGVTRGLLDAGIEVLAGVDFDKNVKETYEKNNSPARFIHGDITKITKQDVENIFDGHKGKRLLAGCAPCQPFSKKNKDRLNPTDPRRTLLRYFADLVDETLPDFVFMENVSGIANLEGDVLEYFIKILNKNGYSHDEGLMNAVHYGVPQNRKRYVLLAARDSHVTIPKGLYDGKKSPFKTVEQTIKSLPPISAGEAPKILPNHQSPRLDPINLERIQATQHSGGRRKDWPIHLRYKCHYNDDGTPKSGHSDIGGRMDWKKPAPTLTTRFTSYTTGAYGHPEQDRAISLREGALLQSFPENYVFYGAPGQIAKQIGNAVPPKMAEEFGKYFCSLTE